MLYKDLDEILGSDGVEGEMLASGLQLRGVLNLRQGRESRALEDFTAAIKTVHENGSLRSVCFANRGITFINVGNFDRAVSDLKKAIELDPTSGFAYAGRGLAYLRQDKIDSARRDGEKALSLHPDEETRKIAEKILSELSVSASGPLSVVVPINEGEPHFRSGPLPEKWHAPQISPGYWSYIHPHRPRPARRDQARRPGDGSRKRYGIHSRWFQTQGDPVQSEDCFSF